LCLVLVFLGSFGVQGEWKVVSPRLATALLGVSVTDANTVWVVGDDNGVGPVVLSSTDGGGNWTDQITGLEAVFLLDITMADAQNGFTSGLGLLKIEGALYTSNGGANWTQSSATHIDAIFQSVGHTSASDVWQVGTWSKLGQLHGNGVEFSSDGGNTFTGVNWNSNYSARYGSFLDSNVGWISGGNFPTSNEEGDIVHDFNHHLTFADGLPVFRTHAFAKTPADPFAAVLAGTTDGGKTWTTYVNYVGTGKEGYYFNGISFINTTHGWVVGEGNYKNGSSFAFIAGTTNGGQNWTEQLYVDGGSIIQIRVFEDLTGWACGGENVGAIDMKGSFWKTTDGQTWTLDSTILENYQLNLGAIDVNTAYSVGIGLEGASSVSRYETA